MSMNFKCVLDLSVVFHSIFTVFSRFSCLCIWNTRGINWPTECGSKENSLYRGRWDCFCTWTASRYFSTSPMLTDFLNFNVLGCYIHILYQIIQVQLHNNLDHYWDNVSPGVITCIFCSHILKFKKLRLYIRFSALTQ